MDFESTKTLILMPVEQIFYDGVREFETRANKIEDYQIMSLVSNSIFLNITGFLEQKFFVIHSFYRMHFDSNYKLSQKNSFSTFDSKNDLYKDIINLIEDGNFFNKGVLEERIGKYTSKVLEIFCYKTKKLNDDAIDKNSLLAENEKKLYEKAIKFRNNIAHNIFARQSVYFSGFEPKAFVDSYAWLDYIKVLIIVDSKFTQLSQKFLSI